MPAAMESPNPSVSVPLSAGNRRRSALFLGLYFIPVLLACVWVLSMPVFPSQDGPLHLYYVNALRQLLAHQPGPYTDAYLVKTYVTPYSSYYYSLIGLGNFVSLEMADKIIVCVYLLLFATATRSLIRAVSGKSEFVPFLLLPVLLNWPLMMGFVNYSLSTCLACFALTAWCTTAGRRDLRPRALFLLLVLLMMVTHPVPWLFVLAFVFFDLGLRLLRSRMTASQPGGAEPLRFFRLDLVTALLACTPYPYLKHFNGMVQTTDPHTASYSPLARFFSPRLLPFAERAQSFLRTFGVDIYAGSGSMPRIYRAGITLVLFSVLITAVVALLRNRRSATWTMADTWLLFTLTLFPFLLFLPDTLSDHFYFVSRLGILFFVSCVVSGSLALPQFRRVGVPLAAFAYLLCLLTLGMAVRYISPVARMIATLDQAPAMPADRLPGLVMQSVGTNRAPGLDYLPYFWAGAHYFRHHDLLLFNTAWLGDPIILVGARPDKLRELDERYYEGLPILGSQLLPNEAAAAATLEKVDFVLIMRQDASLSDSPLADARGETVPGRFATGWTCVHGEPTAWYLCRPPTEAFRGLASRMH